MKRHDIIIASFIGLALVALALRRYALCGGVLVALLILIGVAVAFPQLGFYVRFVCRAETSKKQVALTFDDGPDPRSTPQLLALLRERKVPAAFFCVGARVDANPGLAAQIVREGHLLENHSYTHSHFTNFYPPARLRREISRTQTAIENAAGVAPRCYRPPAGMSNSWTDSVVQKTGLLSVAWSIRSLDTIITNPGKVVRRIVSRLHPGAIILLHDGDIAPQRVLATVSMLLDELAARGYEVVRLDKLIDFPGESNGR